MRKGISPIVAAVLLIAVTMSLAGLLAYWASNFVKTELPTANSSDTTCQFTGFQIYQCNYSNSSQNISVVLYNYRTNPVTDIQATVFDVNNLPVWVNETVGGTLNPGAIIAYTISGIPSNFTKIVLTSSSCPQISPQETTCTRG